MDDTAFGLHLAEQTNPREAGLLFYVVSAAKNFGEAWALFARYCRIVNESVRLKISRQPEGVFVEISFVEDPKASREANHGVSDRGGSQGSPRDHRPRRPTNPISPSRMCAKRTCGVRALLWLSRRVWSPLRSTGVFQRNVRSSANYRRPKICWRRSGRSAMRRRERATRRWVQYVLRSRTRFNDCCRMDGLTRKPSPRCWPSASELFRAGYRVKARPSRPSLTSCALASRSSISKSQVLHCRKSRGSWATRARPRSIMPSSVGRAVRHPPLEKRSAHSPRARQGSTERVARRGLCVT